MSPEALLEQHGFRTDAASRNAEMVGGSVRSSGRRLTTAWSEPFRRALARNVALAAVVGMGLALQRHDRKLLLPVAALALWFSLGGHYIELAFLNGLRARIPQGRLAQAGGRLLVWFSGGVLLYVGMAATARVLAIEAPRLRLWWSGGFLLIGVELAVHALLAMRGRPNFYNGRG